MMLKKSFITITRRAFLKPALSYSQTRALFDSLINNGKDQHDDGFEAAIKSLKGRIKFQDGTNNIAHSGEQNAFKLFDIEQNYKIDEGKLKREMRNLQRVFHPDKFVQGRVQSEYMVTGLSSMINHFYNILQNPYERGKYLLAIVLGQSVSEIEKSLERVQLDGKFLTRVLELQEIAENAELCDNNTLNKTKMDLESELSSLIKELDGDFQCKNIENIKLKLSKIKFVTNCHQVISNRLEDYGSY